MKTHNFKKGDKVAFRVSVNNRPLPMTVVKIVGNEITLDDNIWTARDGKSIKATWRPGNLMLYSEWLERNKKAEKRSYSPFEDPPEHHESFANV